MVVFSRYIFAVAMVVIAAVLFVKWQTNDSEVISFNHVETDDEAIREPEQKPHEQLVDEVEGETDPLPESLEPTPAMVFERALSHSQEPLTEEQLATKIAEAKMDLARVEAANVRKNAQFDRILENESSVEMPLLEVELAYRIEGWKRAWEAGDLDLYLSFYSDRFSPSREKSLEQWKNTRARLVSPQRSIKLELTDFSVNYDAASLRSLVTFTQFYKSGGFEETVNKRLILENQENQWKIVSETTE